MCLLFVFQGVWCVSEGPTIFMLRRFGTCNCLWYVVDGKDPLRHEQINSRCLWPCTISYAPWACTNVDAALVLFDCHLKANIDLTLNKISYFNRMETRSEFFFFFFIEWKPTTSSPWFILIETTSSKIRWFCFGSKL